ncbi:MAG: ABC transporter permease subunit [Gammaproteobacteria bacterium]|nr:ABC transporter permease subunit [Gammaproteobacteria bacterium]
MSRTIWLALTGSALARICTVLMLTITMLAIVGPAIAGWDANEIDWQAIESGPDLSHWFGTDLIGRDLFARCMLGARVSLSIAVVATTISMLIGIPWGALAGYIGGYTDHVMMRIVDTLYALPFVLIVILLVVVFGRNPVLLFVGLGAVFWLDVARIVRGQTLRVRQQPFISAAQSLGASTSQIVWRHVIPNVSGPALVYASLTIPGVILAETFISFLGLGVQEPDTSWGVLISDGAQSMESAPWTLIFPAGLLGVTVWCCNMLGDRLRDQVDQLSSRYNRRPAPGTIAGGTST